MVNGNPCSVIDSDTVRGIAFLVDKTPGERADGFHDARLITSQGSNIVEPWTAEVARQVMRTLSSIYLADLMVARGGIAPPTRGIAVLANLHPP